MRIKNDPRSLLLFAEYVEAKTGRKWSIPDLQELRRRVYMCYDPTARRQPIKYDDWLCLASAGNGVFAVKLTENTHDQTT